jgi:prepilin-type N-terminal cleavage/methylation domain-containing protein
MQTRPRSGFTLIELIVVIAVILTLVSISVPVIRSMMDIGTRAKCANNLKQIGNYILGEAYKAPAGQNPSGFFPRGGAHPADWGEAANYIKEKRILYCPGPDSDSPSNPLQKTLYSYGYVGNLTPVYVCGCGTCNSEKRIWKLYWSGVDYTGDHEDSDHIGGARATNCSDFAGSAYKLASNLQFTQASVDENEPTVPTIPVHQDNGAYGMFSGNDRAKFRTQRALRQVPENAEDKSDHVPLAFDLVMIRRWNASISQDLSDVGAPNWMNAHRYITPENKDELLWANHCETSAASKDGWGANVLFCSGAVRWLTWDELRFQVMAYNGLSADSKWYFFF